MPSIITCNVCDGEQPPYYREHGVCPSCIDATTQSNNRKSETTCDCCNVKMYRYKNYRFTTPCGEIPYKGVKKILYKSNMVALELCKICYDLKKKELRNKLTEINREIKICSQSLCNKKHANVEDMCIRHKFVHDYCTICHLKVQLNLAYTAKRVRYSALLGSRSHNSDNNIKVCSYCATDHIITCNGCSDFEYHEEDIHDLEESNYCRECIDRHRMPRSSPTIRNYSYKPLPEFGEMYKRNKLYIGVELEVECTNGGTYSIARKVNNIDEYIYLKSDSSIHDGFEIVTHPRTLKKHMDNDIKWKEILSFLISKGCNSHNTSTCGLHTHINKEYLSESDQIKLGTFVTNNFKNFVRLARRYNMSYSKIKKIKRGAPSKIKDSRDRGEAINWTNSATIEFRLFRGTLKYETLMATLQLVDATCRFVKSSSITDFINKPKIMWGKFIEFVKENKYKELMTYISHRKAVKRIDTDESDTYSSHDSTIDYEYSAENEPGNV